jgi:hypothetical protein
MLLLDRIFFVIQFRVMVNCIHCDRPVIADCCLEGVYKNQGVARVRVHCHCSLSIPVLGFVRVMATNYTKGLIIPDLDLKQLNALICEWMDINS